MGALECGCYRPYSKQKWGQQAAVAGGFRPTAGRTTGVSAPALRPRPKRQYIGHGRHQSLRHPDLCEPYPPAHRRGRAEGAGPRPAHRLLPRRARVSRCSTAPATAPRWAPAAYPCSIWSIAPEAKPDDTRTAGLYHTAFLMPTRGDLARWLLHMPRSSACRSPAPPTTRSARRSISTIRKVTASRSIATAATEEWVWQDGMVKMTTAALDLDDLARAGGNEGFAGAPEGLRIGHVHLRVGDIDQAERFYRDIIGLDVIRRRGGATFMSSGRYHHHIGSNVWHSAGAGMRDAEPRGTGLVRVRGCRCGCLRHRRRPARTGRGSARRRRRRGSSPPIPGARRCASCAPDTVHSFE